MNRHMAIQTIGYGENTTCTISSQRAGQHEVSDLRELHNREGLSTEAVGRPNKGCVTNSRYSTESNLVKSYY